MLRQSPTELFTRFYDYDITMESFDFTLSDAAPDAATPDVIIFRHGETVLAAPLEFFPESDFFEGNVKEIFDRLALLNNYYRDMLMPIVLLIFLMSAFMLLSLSGIIAVMMGLGRKMVHALPLGKRLRVFAACFWLPAVPTAVIGFLLPVFHLFIFQITLGLLAWRVQKLL
jgi:hypothetical protein